MSASPVISKSFSVAGNHNINFTAKNLGKYRKTKFILSTKIVLLWKYVAEYIILTTHWNQMMLSNDQPKLI